jgi:hypothetical protein
MIVNVPIRLCNPSGQSFAWLAVFRTENERCGKALAIGIVDRSGGALLIFAGEERFRFLQSTG